MRVVVVGPGAVGSFLAGTLALGGAEVILAGRGSAEPEPSEIAIHGPGRDHAQGRLRRAGIGAAIRSEPPDAVVLAVRQPDLPTALASIEAWPAVPTVTVQNGIGAEALVAEARPNAPLLAASLTASVALGPDGAVRRLTRGGIGLSAVAANARPTAHALAAAFDRGALRVRVYRDAAAMKWSKLLANLVGNATSALLDLDPADVYADPRLFPIERGQLREALAVIRALDLRPVALPGADARLLALAVRLPPLLAHPILARAVAGGRGGKSPSLRLALGRAGDEVGETEVRWLNGAVARDGRRLGIPTPVNAALADLVEEAAADPERRSTLRGDPDALLRAIRAGSSYGP